VTVRVIVSVSVLAGALLLTQFRSVGEPVPVRQPLRTLPRTLGDWPAREDSVLDPDVIRTLELSDYLMRRDVDPSGRSVWLYVGYWAAQRRGAQMHSPKNCLPGSGWEAVDSAIVQLPVPSSDGPISLNRYLVQKGTEQQLVLYWYQYQRDTVADEIRARMRLVKNSVVHHRTDGALVRLSTAVKSATLSATQDVLAGYVEHLYPRLIQHLPD
jgi:EpsI family protein